MHLVLFDIDGTILLGQGIGARAMQRAGRRVLGPEFSLEGIDFGGALDPWIYRQAAQRMQAVNSEELHDHFREQYLAELRLEIARSEPPQLLPGVEELVHRLSARIDVTLGLVTGNYADAAPLKLRAAGLAPELFTLGAFGDHAPTRPELIRLALKRWAATGATADPSRTIVVGDTPRDVDCARSNRCRCLAVATGHHSEATLVEAGADWVVRDLTDPEVLLRWLR